MTSLLLTTQADWQAGVLPPQVEATAGGDLRLYRAIASFARNSTRFLPDGSSVTANNPGFWWGRFHNYAHPNHSSGGDELGSTAGFVPYWDTTVERDLTAKKSGAGSIKMTVTQAMIDDSHSNHGVIVSTSGLPVGAIPTVPANTYVVVSAQVLFPQGKSIDIGGRPIRVSDNANMAENTGSKVVPGTGDWQRIYTAFTATADFYPLFQIRSGDANGPLSFWVDEVQIELAVAKDAQGNWIPTDFSPGGVKGAFVPEEGTTAYPSDAATLTSHTTTTNGTITDLGSGITNGTYRVYFSKSTIGDKRVYTPLITVDKTKDSAWTFEFKPVQGPVIQFYGSGDALNGVSYSEKNLGSYNLSTGVLSVATGITLLEHTLLSDGFRRVVLKIAPSWWNGTGSTVKFGMYGDWNSITTFDYYYRKPQWEQKSYGTSWAAGGTRSAETLTIPTTGLSPSQGLCIRMWVYVNSLAKRNDGQANRVFHLPPAVNSDYNGIEAYHGGTLWYLGTFNDAQAATSGSYSDSVTADGWHLFEVKAKAAEAKLMIDGVARVTLTGPNLPSALWPVGWVGSKISANYLNTYFDDVEVLTTYPSDADSLAAFQRTSPAIPTANTIALLHMDGNLTSDYPSQGTVVTQAIDLGAARAAPVKIWCTSTEPAGTSAQLTGVRTSADGMTWSEWTPVVNDVTPWTPLRYLQARFVLATSDPSQTPVVQELTVLIQDVGGATSTGSARIMTGPADYSDTFWAALRNPERRPLVRVTYCDLNWVPQEIITGEVTPDSSFALDEQGRRSVSLRLKNLDGSRTPDPTSDIWFGRFTVEWGLRTAAGQEFVDLGRLVAVNHGVSVSAAGGWTSLTLADPSALWGTLRDYWVIQSTDRIRDVIMALALDAGVSDADLNFINTEEIVGSEMAGHPGDRRWDLAARLAGAAQEVGQILRLVYGPRQCLLYPEVDPATAKAPVLSLDRGDGLLISLDKAWEAHEFANRIQVYGGSGKYPTIFSEIADTSSGPYGTIKRGDICYKWPQGAELDPLITTQERADARRDYLYRMKRTAQEVIRLNGLVIPGLAFCDVIHARETAISRTDHNYSVRSYSFGLGTGGTMSLAGRRVVMP